MAYCLSTVSITALADEKKLEQCRSIQAELSRLEAFRKAGGTAKEMDSWKRRMHDKQDDYSRLYCRQYRFLID
jgi:hypothetical protein